MRKQVGCRYFCFMTKFYRFRFSTVCAMSNLLILFSLLCLSSCVTKKEVLILNNGDISSIVRPAPLAICQQGDILEIKIYSINHDVVAPFNNFLETNVSESSKDLRGYLIDEQDNISLPLVGKVKAGGLTLIDLEKVLVEKLTEFVKDPIVSVRIINFEITVLGEVKSPGRVKIPKARANILEAIGFVGDLTNFAKKNDILIVREVNGKRVEFHLDLTQKQLFESEGFYLKQNDLVYVAPIKPLRYTSSALNSVRNSMILVMTSIVGTWLISLLSK